MQTPHTERPWQGFKPAAFLQIWPYDTQRISCWYLHVLQPFYLSLQMSSKRSSSFRRAIANGRRTLQREILLDETGLGLYKRFVRYVAYEILPCETDRRWYFHQNRLCPPPVFIAVVTIVQVRSSRSRSPAPLVHHTLLQHVEPVLPCCTVTATNPQLWLKTLALLAQALAPDPRKRFSAFDHTLLLWAPCELVTHLGVRGLVGAFNAIPPSWSRNPLFACRIYLFIFLIFVVQALILKLGNQVSEHPSLCCGIKWPIIFICWRGKGKRKKRKAKSMSALTDGCWMVGD